jgi:hypothetical protein
MSTDEPSVLNAVNVVARVTAFTDKDGAARPLDNRQ